jgi:hypothetical protein
MTTIEDLMVVGTLVTGYYVIDLTKRDEQDNAMRVSPVFNYRHDALSKLTAMRRASIN